MENIYELDDDSVEVTRSYLLGLDYKQPDAVDEALSAMGQILIRITACQIFLVGMHDEGDLLKAGALDSILAARARFYGRLLADCKSRHELTPLGDVFARALTEAERLVPEIESLAKKLLELFAEPPGAFAQYIESSVRILTVPFAVPGRDPSPGRIAPGSLR